MTPPASWKMMEAEMYGMMPSAKTVARDRPAAQHVVEAEEPGGSRVPDEVGERLHVHARRRDVGADPIDQRGRAP